MLGAASKQAADMETTQTYEAQKRVIGGQGPQHPDIVKVLETTSSKKYNLYNTFIFSDALDECQWVLYIRLCPSAPTRAHTSILLYMCSL